MNTRLMGRCNMSMTLIALGVQHPEFMDALEDHALDLDRSLLNHCLDTHDPLKELAMVQAHDRAHRLYTAVAKADFPAD